MPAHHRTTAPAGFGQRGLCEGCLTGLTLTHDQGQEELIECFHHSPPAKSRDRANSITFEGLIFSLSLLIAGPGIGLMLCGSTHDDW